MHPRQAGTSQKYDARINNRPRLPPPVDLRPSDGPAWPRNEETRDLSRSMKEASAHIHALPSCKYDWLLPRCSTLDDAPFISRVSQHVCAHRPSTTNDLVGRVTRRNDWPPVGEARGISQTGFSWEIVRRRAGAQCSEWGAAWAAKRGEHLGEEQGGRLEKNARMDWLGYPGMEGVRRRQAGRENRARLASKRDGRTHTHTRTHRDEAHAGRTPVTGLCVRYGGFLPLLSPAPRRIC